MKLTPPATSMILERPSGEKAKFPMIGKGKKRAKYGRGKEKAISGWILATRTSQSKLSVGHDVDFIIIILTRNRRIRYCAYPHIAQNTLRSLFSCLIHTSSICLTISTVGWFIRMAGQRFSEFDKLERCKAVWVSRHRSPPEDQECIPCPGS